METCEVLFVMGTTIKEDSSNIIWKTQTDCVPVKTDFISIPNQNGVQEVKQVLRQYRPDGPHRVIVFF